MCRKNDQGIQNFHPQICWWFFPGSRKGRAQQVTLLQPASGSAAVGHARQTRCQHLQGSLPSQQTSEGFCGSKLELWIWMDLNGSDKNSFPPTSSNIIQHHWCHHSESYNSRWRDGQWTGPRGPFSTSRIAPCRLGSQHQKLWIAYDSPWFLEHIYIYTQYTW